MKTGRQDRTIDRIARHRVTDSKLRVAFWAYSECVSGGALVRGSTPCHDFHGRCTVRLLAVVELLLGHISFNDQDRIVDSGACAPPSCEACAGKACQ